MSDRYHRIINGLSAVGYQVFDQLMDQFLEMIKSGQQDEMVIEMERSLKALLAKKALRG